MEVLGTLVPRLARLMLLLELHMMGRQRRDVAGDETRSQIAVVACSSMGLCVSAGVT